MSLPLSFNSASSGNEHRPSTPEINVIQQQYMEIPLYECSQGFAADHPNAFENEYITPQPFNYGVRIEFEPGKGREFVDSPDFRANYHSITNTISEMMGETLAFEIVRDMDAHATHGTDMSDSEYSKLMTDIHENTLMDAEAALEELPFLLQQTFPDSGIVGAKLSYMQGMDLMCSSPDSPYASLPSPADDFSTGAPAASLAFKP